jgi:hypothetical protein
MIDSLKKKDSTVQAVHLFTQSPSMNGSCLLSSSSCLLPASDDKKRCCSLKADIAYPGSSPGVHAPALKILYNHHMVVHCLMAKEKKRNTPQSNLIKHSKSAI